MRKQIVAIILALVLTASILPTDALAADPFLTEVQTKTEQLLYTVELQKTQFGFENVDFDTLALGNEIPAYEVTENGLLKISTIHYFPVLSNEEWVATVIVTYNSNAEMSVELSTKYINNYETLLKSGDSGGVALVYDNVAEYLFVGSNYSVVGTYEEMFGRAKLTSSIALDDVVGLASHMRLTVGVGNNTRATVNNVFLSVPQIEQPTDQTCWAASIASVLQYYGESYDVYDVCTMAGLSTSQGANMYQCTDIIEDFGYSWGKRNTLNDYYHSEVYIEDVIVEMYINRSPVIGRFWNEESSYHAVVLQGYVYDLMPVNTVTYMDPYVGAYYSSTVPDDGKITIAFNGQTYKLHMACAVYE